MGFGLIRVAGQGERTTANLGLENKVRFRVRVTGLPWCRGSDFRSCRG